MTYLYSAIFSPIEDGTGYYATVPDIPGCSTSGKDLSEALDLVTDALSGCLCVLEDKNCPIHTPTSQNNIERNPEDICTLVHVDTLKYRAATDTRAVRKNVSLPAWMVTLADRMELNCSQILQEALRKKFNMHT